MKPFSKQELIGVALIILVVFSFTLVGLKDSVRRSRDVQRKADLGAISDALYKFQEEFGFFPPSEKGMIKVCKGENFVEIIEGIRKSEVFNKDLFFGGLRPCEYGKDSFRDVTNDESPAYLEIIPSDPKRNKGFNYNYLSNTNRFQIYAYLEGESEEDEYNPQVVSRNLSCGAGICSFGKSSGDTPLDISIEEYERKLLEKSQTGN